VVVNLLSNAFKFSCQDPTLSICFTESTLVLQVIDKGIGIPAVELVTLFQAFFRASNTSGIPGTGLGLVIARQFVELHGGQLSIESEERRGTTCCVRIPIEQANTLSEPLSSTYISEQSSQ
jgi:signal transduction histidine kinase